MSDERKYVRVYYSVVNDERFDEIYHDPRRFGTWLQLLLIADAMFPVEAPIPAYVHRPSLKALVDCGLVELRAHQHFVMHGLASERGMRSQTGRNAAAVRWQSERNADPMPSKAETSIDKTSRADARDEPHIEAWLQVKYRLPTDRQRAFLDRYLSVFDVTGPQRMARLILEHPDDPIAALKEDLDRHREERLAGLGNGNAPKPRVISPVKRTEREPWQDLLRDKLAADEEALQERTRLPGAPA